LILVKNMIKKISKFITSRIFYILLGVLFSLSIFAAHAAWNSYVSSGQTLTKQLWDDVVDKLIELDAKGPKDWDCIDVTGSQTFGSSVWSTATANCPNDRVIITGHCNWNTAWADTILSRQGTVGNGYECYGWSTTNHTVTAMARCCK
jgi:hypothetical protein